MGLAQRIEEQFKKYPELRVLFFFEVDNDTEAEIDSLYLENIRVIKYSNDPFNLKVKLNGEWAAEKIFLYFSTPAPTTHETFKKFPLMDMLVANKELRLGDVNEFMERYHLPMTNQSLVSQYMQELKSSKIQEVLKPILNAHSLMEESLQRGLVSAFLKFTEPQSWDTLLIKLFVLTKPTNQAEFARVEKRLKENKLEIPLTRRLSNLLDESIDQVTTDLLIRLLSKIKYNIIVQNLTPANHDPYEPLKIKHSGSLTKLSIFFEQGRMHPKFGAEFIETILLQGKDIKEETILHFYGAEADYAWIPDELKWLILAEQMKQIYIDPAKALTDLEKINFHLDDNREIRDSFKTCLYISNCLKLINSIETYRLNIPEDFFVRYKEEYFRIDTAYRKAVSKLTFIDQTEIPVFVDLEKLRSILNTNYEEWLEKINREWVSCLQSKQFEYSKLAIPKQYDFFSSEVAPFPDQKVVVFISDALRYEVAVELLHEMHNDSKSEAVIRAMLASIPSKTSVGMSNLLPGNDRVFGDDKITIDGISANNRELILQKINNKSIAVSYSKIDQNTHEQNRELFKAPIVYIYHDVIDSTGDKRSSERRTFNIVEDAISEIKKMVKKIHSAYNVSKILITSDHGFIYNDRPITEADKEDSPEGNKIIEHKRFMLYDKPIKPSMGYCIPLNVVSKFKDDRWIVIPASTNRYKRQGVAHQFAHGGASMQELIVPVIESARRREEITRKVPVKLLTKDPKIISNILKVEILQEGNVSRYEKARTVKLGIYKNYDLVSTLFELVLDSTSELASERLFICTVNLTKPELSKTALTLKIFDIEDNLNALIEKPVLNNTLIQTDF